MNQDDKKITFTTQMVIEVTKKAVARGLYDYIKSFESIDTGIANIEKDNEPK